MGLMQHHDAVTGTEKQNVAEDYAFRLDKVGWQFFKNKIKCLTDSYNNLT